MFGPFAEPFGVMSVSDRAGTPLATQRNAYADVDELATTDLSPESRISASPQPARP